MFERPCIFDE